MRMAGARLCFRINMQVCGFGVHGYAGVAANPCGGGCGEFAGGVGANFARSRQLVGCVGVSVVCCCRGAARMGRDGLSGGAGKPLWHGRKGFRVCPLGPSGMAKGPVLRPGRVSVAGRKGRDGRPAPVSILPRFLFRDFRMSIFFTVVFAYLCMSRRFAAKSVPWFWRVADLL